MENLSENIMSKRIDEMNESLKKINNKLKFFVILTIIMLIPSIVAIVFLITTITSMGLGSIL